MPYSALARTFEEIENISARLKIIGLLSNYFRSVIVLTPEDLLRSIYLCLNKLAPAYEGLELGIAETNLMKAVCQSTGRSMNQLKLDIHEVGDIGLVAEKSKSNQRMLFKPARLTVRGVFDKLKEIAKMSGHSVSIYIFSFLLIYRGSFQCHISKCPSPSPSYCVYKTNKICFQSPRFRAILKM